MEQQAQIETCCNNLEMLDFEENLEESPEKVIDEICRLIDLAHRLRDNMLESMVKILVVERRLDQLSPHLKQDSQLGIYSRAGLEHLFWDWWKNDISRQRLVSVIFVNIDNFSQDQS